MERLNVSSVQDFMQCRFRWWAKWVMNRVPVATSPALDAGRILHRAFEDHAVNETPLGFALAVQCREFRALIPSAHPAAQASALKAVVQMEDLIEAMPLWRDKFPVDEVLEVEEPFEWADPVVPGLLWIGRPDRVVTSSRRIWHYQRRGLAGSMNFGTYVRLAARHYHEHLYGLALRDKYKKKRKVRGYGGTVFDLVRKLKFRTNVGKKNEKVKTAEEMFFQAPVSYNLDGPVHRSVMASLRQHVREMRRVRYAWEEFEEVPAPNEKMSGGFSGNSEDPYYRVLIGEVKLDDEEVFKQREETYDIPTEEGDG